MRLICYMASSIDGFISRFDGETDTMRRISGFGCEEDHKRLLAALTKADAVIIGRKTMELMDKNFKNPFHGDWLVLSRSQPFSILDFYQEIRQKYKTVLLFGGGEINQLFFNENLVDELNITIAPMLMASPLARHIVSLNLNKNVQFRLDQVESAEEHVFIRYIKSLKT